MAVAISEAPRGACATLRARNSSSSPTTAQVILRHPSGAHVAVREALLRSCSPMLDELLSSTANCGASFDRREILVDDCSLPSLQAFVALLQLGSYDDPFRLTTAQIAEQAPLSMALVSRYKASGLLHLVQQAVNQHPTEENVLAVLTSEHSLHWVSPHAQVLLAALRRATSVRAGKLSAPAYARPIGRLRRTRGVLRALTPLAACQPTTTPRKKAWRDADGDGCAQSRTSVL